MIGSGAQRDGLVTLNSHENCAFDGGYKQNNRRNLRTK